MKRLIFALLVIAACSIPASAKYSGGSGDAGDPYQIANVADLMTLANDANDYNNCFIMTADIDLDPNLPGNQTFTTAVIAPDTNPSGPDFEGTAFTGSFDGNGKKILNLRIDTADANNDYLGLFGCISGSAAQVKNLGIDNAVITGGADSDFFGGLCGYIDHGTISNCYAAGQVTGGTGSTLLGGLCGDNCSGTISNCYADGSVSGHSFIGGLCGYHQHGGTISNSYATGQVTGGNSVGGLCGLNQGAISNCYATGHGQVIGGTSSGTLGGLCGQNANGTISNSYAIGQVTGDNGSSYLGGLCGWNYFNSTISNCYATGQVTGGDDSFKLGGLCGSNYDYGTISKCYATGQVTGGSNSYYLGGLCGYNTGNISSCYATGQVIGGTSSLYLGGLCGRNYYGYYGSAISNSYATGTVTGSSNKGGFCGSNSSSITGCFWDVNTSGMNTSAGGTGKTTAQMQTQSTFTDAGWDFVWETTNGTADIWAICEGVSYPKLAWQFIAGDFDNNRKVDFADFALMGNKWMQADSNLYCGGSDLTGDGLVDLEDLAALTENWLQGL